MNNSAWQYKQEVLATKTFAPGMKSVKSVNPCKSVIQTIYDIVKAHGGELKVETKEAEGTAMIIYLITS